MSRLLAIAVCLVGLAGCTPTVLEFSLPDLDGNAVRPTPAAVSVVSFWATWCAPCQAELAEMNEMYGRLHPRGLELYAVSVDGPDTVDDVEPWVREQGYLFPVLLDPDDRLFRRYSRDGVLPYLVIFDDAGVRVGERMGYEPGGVKALERELEAMLR